VCRSGDSNAPLLLNCGYNALLWSVSLDIIPGPSSLSWDAVPLKLMVEYVNKRIFPTRIPSQAEAIDTALDLAVICQKGGELSQGCS
jgi:hypothetical protein